MKASQDLKTSLEVAVAAYETQISGAAAYLAARGITEQAAKHFRLGYVAVPEIGHEQYVGRIVIPYLTPTGVVDVRFRSTETDVAGGFKYLGRPGAELMLYNVNAFNDDTEVICVTEGEFDCIAATMAGLTAVSCPGANGWKPFYARAFADYRRVLVLADGDSAGRELGKKIAQSVDVAVVVSMPDGLDVNDVVLQRGADGLRKMVGM